MKHTFSDGGGGVFIVSASSTLEESFSIVELESVDRNLPLFDANDTLP